MESQKNWETMRDYYRGGKSNQNSLEILKQEKRETVLVNALAYFLHPRRGGKMQEPKHRMLKNLIEKTDKQHYINSDYEKSTGNLLCMKTEFPCISAPQKEPKRLDLFLEFENYCIGIEAKVDADLTNPLETYRASVEERATNNGCEFATILLLTKKKKNELRWDEENYPNRRSEWPIITWEELTKNCDYNRKSGHKVESIESLLSALKKIDDDDQGIDVEGLEVETLKEKAEDLQKAIKLEMKENGSKWNSVKCEIWTGDGIIRHIAEPRVVINYSNRNFVIDVCIGFRGVQFIVFNEGKYKPELYKKVCEEYSFFYWQDYNDSMEHFDRYLLSDKKGEDSKTGPLFPKGMSVEERNTVFYKNYETLDGDSWTKRAIKEIEEILELKNV
jgi:hypothetical protein